MCCALLIAGKSVLMLDNDCIALSRINSSQQVLQPVAANDGCARLCRVMELFHDFIAFPLRVGAAKGKLVSN
ncbi:MAG: hypothetical protein A3H25_18225 [Sphingomonadales bacterium RIFCSPLOWO2_12_FULL_63_15]|nr:MAG: hypothetical protein A3H25_18225 [Sphingomonadales bacterium RIFCSPLOWO2_12_FULL_63_15]